MQQHKPQFPRPSILIVDDDSDFLCLLGRQLTEAGYDIRPACTGAEALGTMLETGPRIVIADWVMPGMNGIELCRRIRRHEGIAFAYILLVTATQTGDSQLEEAFHAGADDFLLKPLKPDELLARLQAAERICRLHEELAHRTRDACSTNAKLAVAYEQLDNANRKLHEVAVTDELTGMPNRRQILERLGHEWKASTRRGTPLSCVVVDIDHFKAVNDTYGHPAGDAVLRAASKTMQASTRDDEEVGRLGGEEFLLVCPHTTAEEAAVAAERLRRAVCDQQIRADDISIPVTISLGVADRTAATEDAETLLSRADAALYAAKDAGRNTVRVMPGGKTAEAVRPLPLTRPDPPRATDADTATVLMVEDDELVRGVYRRWLEQDGYNITEAEDGLQAIELVEACPPDIILMDAAMPGMDGYTAARHLKSDPRTRAIPIIFIAGRGGDADILSGLQAGADEYLTKPVHEQELLIRVRGAIRLHREFRESNEIRGEQSRALGLIADFTQDIATVETRDEVLAVTMSAAAALIGSARVCVLMPSGDETFNVASAIGFSPGQLDGLCISTEASISGCVLEQEAPLLLASPDDLAEFAERTDAVLFSSLPSVAVPLRVPGTTLGVIWISGRHGHSPIRAIALECVRLIANIAAAALHERITRESRDEARHSIVVALAKLAEHRDPDTGKHLDRVTQYCTVLARRLAQAEKYRAVITDEFVQDLQHAVPLHDIGKVAIPDRILLKPGKLDHGEFTIMQTHAAIGAQTLRSVMKEAPGVRFLAVAEEIARGHHEWFNGNGYPCGLSGDAIPLPARIAAVADVYDAITTKRPYKEAMSHEAAELLITRSNGEQFDPDVVEAFVACVEQFKELAKSLSDIEQDPPSSKQPQGELLAVAPSGDC